MRLYSIKLVNKYLHIICNTTDYLPSPQTLLYAGWLLSCEICLQRILFLLACDPTTHRSRTRRIAQLIIKYHEIIPTDKA